MSEPRFSPLHHLRATLVLTAGVTTFVLATPGFDQLDEEALVTPADRAEASRWLVAASDVNRTVRLPLVEVLQPLQRPLRIAQNWSLYGSGPSKARRLEVRVDGALLYRSNDPDHTWLARTLRYRRIQPIVVALCTGGTRSDEQLVAFIVGRARRQLDAHDVTVSCTTSPWPGTSPEPSSVRLHASAPDWVVTR